MLLLWCLVLMSTTKHTSISSVEGGDPTPVGVTLVGLQDLSLHPDGRRLAFDVGREEAEVWVMENFLPELKGETVSEVRP